jgi:hypothetical protein
MRIIETKAYLFSELSEEAKQKAIENTRNKENYLDYEWWEFIYEDYKEKAKNLGFDVKRIYFSGFWSQGDGAMFEYDRIDDKLRLEFIESLDISRMRKDWLVNNTYVSGKGVQRGHYYHEKCCCHTIYWEVDNGDLHYSTLFYQWLESFQDDFENFVTDIYEDLCSELYKSLEKEYDYLMSDEQIAEHLEINEYEFTEEGKRL